MNSITKINLSNLRHCNQVWTEMPENDLGRHCQKCSHTIIDFRTSTDSEIAEKHLFSDAKVCGLYNKEQLQEPVKTSPTSNKANFKSIYFASISLLTSSSFAQEKTVIKTEQTDRNLCVKAEVDTIHSEEKVQDNSSESNSIIISGKITDENGEPLAGGNIVVKGSSIGVSTDFDGIYKLTLNQKSTSENIILVYSYIGFSTLEKALDLVELQQNQIINIKLVEDYDSITSFYVTLKPPLHKRIWRNIKNIFKD